MEQKNGALRPGAVEELNSRIDCHDLAQRLGLEQPQQRGNYRSPHHPDKAPSVGVYRDKKSGLSKFMDYSTNEGGGPIDMLMWAEGRDFVSAVRELGQMFGIAVDRPKPAANGQPVAQVKQSLAEFIGEKCRKAVATDDGKARVQAYLEGRGIARHVVDRALAKGTLGLNTFLNDKVPEGQPGHGGPAVAFLVRHIQTAEVVAVDMRYFNPEINGNVKTQCQGEKHGYAWTSDWRRVRDAHTVYVVESPINALSIETCFDTHDDGKGGKKVDGRLAAVAIRGTGNVDNIDWSFCRGKQVISVMDNDLPQSHGPKAGYCPGLSAAWRLHEVMTALDISCLLVDQSGWFDDQDKLLDPINDVNDMLKELGPDATAKELAKLEQWLIPGMVGNEKRLGRPRLFLPSHDYMTYWKYRVQPDFTKLIGKTTKDDDGNEKHEFSDVCGFRVAAVARVRIASPQSTMTGDVDHSPRTVFALSVQVARHGPVLQRRVVDDERLHNVEVWKKLGPVYAPTGFARLVNIWERAAEIGSREAVNFVGLAWRNGKPVVNEGPDCFFNDPRQQCPYHELLFPTGTVAQGLEVVEQFRTTFKDSVALMPLVWGLGAHLKAFLGFWPHFVMQAEKATGKTTLVKRLERSIAMVMSSRQSLQTEFRQMTSLSYTSHPVGWGEMSTNKQDVINKAIHNLQEAYQYEHTRRGSELLDFLLCAPVLLAGEDVPVDSLVGKVVRSELTKSRRGPLIPEACPVFPVKQWLQWLAKRSKDEVVELHNGMVKHFFDGCVASMSDSGAERMVNNYAALGTAWELLCRFLGLAVHSGNFLGDLLGEMNRHIRETVSDRQPWAWVVEKLLSEIAAKKLYHPFAFDVVTADGTHEQRAVLCIRTSHVMDHMRQTPYLREFWDGLPIKSDRVFKRQLEQAGVLVMDANGSAKMFEKTIGHNRVGHMVGLSLPALMQYGLHAVVPTEGGV